MAFEFRSMSSVYIACHDLIWWLFFIEIPNWLIMLGIFKMYLQYQNYFLRQVESICCKEFMPKRVELNTATETNN